MKRDWAEKQAVVGPERAELCEMVLELPNQSVRGVVLKAVEIPCSMSLCFLYPPNSMDMGQKGEWPPIALIRCRSSSDATI